MPRESRVYLVALVVFLASSAATLFFCRTMSDGMAMPGGWTMSMTWMPMPGQGWLLAAIMFLGMWLSMMVAMMLPSTLPTLLIYRRVLAFRGAARSAPLLLLACGYFLVWLAVGGLAYGSGVGFSWAAMRWAAISRAVPAASGAVLVLCGLFQLTRWKTTCLRHCRDPLALFAAHLDDRRADPFWLGLHHGALCVACCWSLMLAQIVLGAMSILIMIAVATIIALEKLLPRGELVGRLAGAAGVLIGLSILWRSLG